jgi:hypothetical protein
VVVTMKADAPAVLAGLRRHTRHVLYHWTPTSAVASVLQHGLLPRRELDARGIAYDPHGYGRAGKEDDFAGHVCLAFMPHWGMLSRASGPPAIIEIDASIVAIDGAFYSPDNTARNEYEFSEVSAWTTAAHLDDLFTGPTDWGLVSYQSEVWVPAVPVEYIRMVHFRSEADRDEVLALLGSLATALPRKMYFAVTPSKFPEPQPIIELDDLPF